MDVGGWLRGLGLGQYEANFRDNKIDFEMLADLTDGDLQELGVPLGDRRRLLRAIAELGAQQPLTTQTRQTPAAPTPAQSFAQLDSAERRPITVMFCDLVGSTELAAALDVEDWRNLLNSYLNEASKAVTGLGGHVLKMLGDGMMAVFGYPRAQENDAERAVRAALAIQKALGELNARNIRSGEPELAARIGIDAGPVVVEARGEVYGDAPNIAARVQALAEPGSVLVTARVQRQTAGLFVAEDKGAHALKGVPELTTLFRIVRASGGRRFGTRALTPLVGREEELDLLRRRWVRALRGEGQLALVVGEPGIGKSRLVQEFRLRLGAAPHTFVEFSSSQLLQNTPLHPVAEWGRQRFGAEAPREQRLADLENTLQLIGLDPAEYVSLLAPLVEIPLPQEHAAKLAPEELRRRQLAALTAWVLAGARSQPIVVAFEDLHWADPTSLDLIQTFAERGAQAPLLIIATARPEFRPAWNLRAHHSVISLSPLDRADVAQMVGELAARHALSKEVIDRVSERTGGVPLFVEEVTRLLLERGEEDGARAIPPTLQQSLAARLDRLGEAREVAQIGAVLGRGFTYALLRAVGGIDDPALQSALDRLADADLLLAESAGPQANYRFKHALIQDAVYDTLLKSRRRELHKMVARVLSDEFQNIAEAQPELVAHHLTEAGATKEAIDYWQRAGRKAAERSANLEAIAHFSHGLELVKLLPEGAPRDQLELDFRVALGVPLIATRGYAAPEVEQTYTRARDLSEKVGGSPQFANIVWGMWVRYLTGGPIGAALEMAAQYRAIAERTQDSGHLLETCQVMGIALFYLGEPAQALSYLSRGSAMYDPAQHHALIYEHGGADTGVAIRTHEALVLWTLGYPDQARRRMQIALETANSLARHPFTVAFGNYFRAWLHKLCREEEIVEQATDVAIKICEEQRFPFWQLASACLRDSSLVERGAEDAVILAMRQALASYQEIGGQLYGPELHGLLSVALANTGRVEEALATLAVALRLVEKSQDRWWHAELHRLHGELILRAPGDRAAAAEAAFEEALAIARAQQAKSWELRAAMSLSRLWRSKGKTAQARALLGDVHGWFTEGFATADLREAAALLAELKNFRRGAAGRGGNAGIRVIK